MNFLFVLHCYPAIEGGVKLFQQIAKELSKKGNKVKVIASDRISTDDLINPNPKSINKLSEKNVVFLPIFTRGRKLFRLAEIILPKSIFSILKKGPVFLPFSIFSKTNLKKNDWIITGLFPLANSFWGYLLARISGAKLIIIPAFHSSDREHQNSFLLKIASKADLVVALSKEEKTQLKKQGVPEKKIIIASGIVDKKIIIDPKGKVTFPKSPVVLFLGVKSAHKNIINLIEAMKIVWNSDKKATLIVAGPETLYSQKIKTKIKNLPKKQQKLIVYRGTVSEREKVKLIDNSTVLVNPSSQESFGIVFAESWARKKPVIGINTKVISQVVSGKRDGLLANRDSPPGLAKKIIAIIENEEMARKMGEKGYQKTIKNYTAEKVVGKILKSINKK